MTFKILDTVPAAACSNDACIQDYYAGMIQATLNQDIQDSLLDCMQSDEELCGIWDKAITSLA